jgi:hypothetical protein
MYDDDDEEEKAENEDNGNDHYRVFYAPPVSCMLLDSLHLACAAFHATSSSPLSSFRQHQLFDDDDSCRRL